MFNHYGTCYYTNITRELARPYLERARVDAFWQDLVHRLHELPAVQRGVQELAGGVLSLNARQTSFELGARGCAHGTVFGAHLRGYICEEAHMYRVIFLYMHT